jgi:oligoendopeptidase F
VPLETELARLGQQFEELAGSITVNYDGREQTLPQMARYQESVDRAAREGAWRAVAERRFSEAEGFSAIYDKMVELRHRVATNAGFGDYVGYAFKSMHRFDYGVQACRDFHAGVEKAVVPLMRAEERRRAAALGVSELRPWDLSVDVKGRPPLKPFTDGRDLMRKSIGTFERLDPRLARMFATLGDGSESRGSAGGACLDLDSRMGKAPGGYQYMRDRSRKPFIFMNAAGLQRDVETMVHEAGHAFHSMLCAGEPLAEYRNPPTEFAEVASMSMELLSMPHWGSARATGRAGGRAGDAPAFFDDAETFRRACREQIKRSFMLLPWIATIDAFQLWVYSNPGHTRDQRAAQWLALDGRFGAGVSWAGIEKYRPLIWQRQLHLFGHPLYYIEYGIAQLGALQLWLHSLERGESSAIEAYMKALSLGGSRPLPELFSAAGLTFDFGPETLQRLTDRVAKELDKLPE